MVAFVDNSLRCVNTEDLSALIGVAEVMGVDCHETRRTVLYTVSSSQHPIIGHKSPTAERRIIVRVESIKSNHEWKFPYIGILATHNLSGSSAGSLLGPLKTSRRDRPLRRWWVGAIQRNRIGAIRFEVIGAAVEVEGVTWVGGWPVTRIAFTIHVAVFTIRAIQM
jgi:hypothetical protein